MLGSKEAETDARARAGEPILIETFGNFFGVQSQGMAQIRGNCCVLLDAEKLVSVMWVPRRTLEIPRSAFREVEIVWSHLGKSKLMRLVKLHFVNAEGAEDSVAWILRDRDEWVRELGAACP